MTGVAVGSQIVCPECGCIEELKEEHETGRRTIGDIINENQAVQEVVERCMSYMWDRVKINEPELDYLCDEMGEIPANVKRLFQLLGYEEDEECEDEFEGMEEDEDFFEREMEELYERSNHEDEA
jgi:hypothetical protein